MNVNIPVKTPLYNGSLINITAKLAFNQCAQTTIIVKKIFVYTFTIPLQLTTNAWMAVNFVLLCLVLTRKVMNIVMLSV